MFNCSSFAFKHLSLVSLYVGYRLSHSLLFVHFDISPKVQNNIYPQNVYCTLVPHSTLSARNGDGGISGLSWHHGGNAHLLIMGIYALILFLTHQQAKPKHASGILHHLIHHYSPVNCSKNLHLAPYYM